MTSAAVAMPAAAMHGHPHTTAAPPQCVRRFEPDHVLGTGTYGQVVRCRDHQCNRTVAVKVARPEAPYRRSAMNEIRVLESLQHCDRVLKYFGNFEQDGRIHIVCELLDKNLYEALKDARFMRMPLARVRMIAESVLTAISELHKIGYIHCDIKPENVMQRGKGDRSCDLIMIDFGSVRKFTENQYYDVQSLWYRAPEVMCGLPYTSKIDSWSIGCLLYELHTGMPLFPGENERDSMSQLIAIVGRPSQTAMARGTKAMQFDFEPSQSVDAYVLQNNLEGSDDTEVRHFRDLLVQLLCPDESLRISATDALAHEFLKLPDTKEHIPKGAASGSSDTLYQPMDHQNSTFSTQWLSNGSESPDEDDDSPMQKHPSPPMPIDDWDCI